MMNQRSSSGTSTLREVIAGIVDPDAKFQDIDGVTWSRFEIQRRELAYRKADAILGILPPAQRPIDREQLAALLYVTRWPDGVWITAQLGETANAYRQADAVMGLLGNAYAEMKPVTMQDVRLYAGEGKLGDNTVLAAVNAILRDRQRRASPLSSTDREYDPDVAPCDDAEFGMKP